MLGGQYSLEFQAQAVSGHGISGVRAKFGEGFLALRHDPATTGRNLSGVPASICWAQDADLLM
jgi:hypothetical protein